MRILQSLSIAIGPQILDHNWLQSAFHDVKAYFYMDIVCKNILQKFAVRDVSSDEMMNEYRTEI